jgi:hypothetical protein
MYGSGIFWCLAVWSTDLSYRFVLWHQWNCSQGWIIECSNPPVLVIFGGWFVMFVHWRLSSQLMPVNWCQCVTVEVICRPVTEKSKWYGFDFSSENEAAAASENMSKEVIMCTKLLKDNKQRSVQLFSKDYSFFAIPDCSYYHASFIYEIFKGTTTTRTHHHSLVFFLGCNILNMSK